MENQQTRKTIEVVHTDLVFPTDTNHYGTIFGGRILAMMDMTAALAAIQFCNEEAVTASFEAVDFKKPIKQGDIVELRAKVIYTTSKSVVVKIDVYRVGKFHSRKDFTCGGYATLVAIDANGEPRPVPQLEVETDEEKELWEVGKGIKESAMARVRKSKDS